ncbi:MAG TPA: hypothetical protein VKG26_13680 [Bacteroidia bacterium]|nr:hypothetical protein [Bacteroidia bacterium]
MNEEQLTNYINEHMQIDIESVNDIARWKFEIKTTPFVLTAEPLISALTFHLVQPIGIEVGRAVINHFLVTNPDAIDGRDVNTLIGHYFAFYSLQASPR